MLLLLPLKDDGPTTRRPTATLALVAALAAVHLALTLMPAEAARAMIERLGAVPAEVARGGGGAWLALLTSPFLHAGWAHLSANLAYLWLYGRGLEAALGRPRYLALFLAAGAAAGLAQGLAAASSRLPLVGSSGGVAGLLGASLVLLPRANIEILVVLGRRAGVVRVPALLGLLAWALVELVGGRVPAGPELGGAASAAHLGGFLAGTLLALLLRRPGTPLPAPARTRPFSVRQLGGRDVRRGSPSFPGT